MLGKQRRRDELLGFDEQQTSSRGEVFDKLQALFRQHFETQFEPLVELDPGGDSVGNVEEAFAEDDSGSDWDGISEENKEFIEVIHHSAVPSSKIEVSREELTAFMVWVQPIRGTLSTADQILIEDCKTAIC